MASRYHAPYHELLLRNRVELMENMELRENLVIDHLYSRKVITRQQKELIEGAHNNEHMVGKLLDIFEKKPTEDIEEMIAALEKYEQRHIVKLCLTLHDPTPDIEVDLRGIQVKLARDYLAYFCDLDLWAWHDIPLRGSINDRYVPLSLCYNNREKKTQYTFENYTEMFEQIGDQQRPLRIVIKGEPGSGKTTLLKKIVYDWSCLQLNTNTDGLDSTTLCLKRYKIVLPLLLRFTSSAESLRYNLRKRLPCLQEQEIQEIMSLLERSPEQVLFLCDGYDEMPEDECQEVQEMIRGNRLSNACCVTTTRDGALSRLAKYPRSMNIILEVLGLNENSSEKFVRQSFAYNNCNVEKALLLWNHIKTNTTLYKLAKKPFLLQLMCYIWDVEGKLKESVCELYTSFAELILGRYDEKKEGIGARGHCDKILPKYHTVLMRLGKLANSYRTDGSLNYTFSQQVVHDTVGNDAETIGFLHKSYPSSPLKQAFWSFLHPSLQEFMAAYYIAHHEDTRLIQIIVSSTFIRIGSPSPNVSTIARRHGILHFLCGMNPSRATGIIKNVVEQGQLDLSVNGLRVCVGLQTNYPAADNCPFPLPKSVLYDLSSPHLNPSVIEILFRNDAELYKNLEWLDIVYPGNENKVPKFILNIIPNYIKGLALRGVSLTNPLSAVIKEMKCLESLSLMHVSALDTEQNFFSSLSALECLHLISCKLDPDEQVGTSSRFSEMLETNKSLRILILYQCCLIETELLRMCHSLEGKQNSLRVLDISCAFIRNASLIGALLSRLPLLQHLQCNACNLDISEIERGFKDSHEALTQLSCCQNRVTAPIGMAKLLCKFPSLVEYRVQFCNLGPQVCTNFFREICKMGIRSKLEQLWLGNNGIVAATRPQFADLFVVFPNLITLDLQDCDLDHSSWVNFLTSWSTHPDRLRHLYLSGNNLKDESLKTWLEVADIYNTGCSLETLYLTRNRGLANGVSICELVKRLPQLKTLDIRICGFREEQSNYIFSKINEILRDREQKLTVYADGNEFSVYCEGPFGMLTVGLNVDAHQGNINAPSIDSPWLKGFGQLYID